MFLKFSFGCICELKDTANDNAGSRDDAPFNRGSGNITDNNNNSTTENDNALAEDNNIPEDSSSVTTADFQSTETGIFLSLHSSKGAALVGNSSDVVVADDSFPNTLMATDLLSMTDIFQNLNSSEIPLSDSSPASDDDGIFSDDNEVSPPGSSGCFGLPHPDGKTEDGCETEPPLEKQKPGKEKAEVDSVSS